MKRKFLLFIILPFVLVVFYFCNISVIYAQEDSGVITDSFDDVSLDNYEHSQDVFVSDGMVKIGPGSILFRKGSWKNPVISVKVRFEKPGTIILHYHASEKGSYGVQLVSELENTTIILFNEQGGKRTDLGTKAPDSIKADEWNELQVDFSGSSHTVKLNDELMLDVKDTDLLEQGGIGFVSLGENPVEIDDLSIKSLLSGNEIIQSETQLEPGSQEEQMPEPEEISEETSAATESAQTVTTDVSTADNSWKTLINSLFITGAAPLDLKTFLINLGLSALFAYILGLVYIYWGASLSNRRKFASNFILLTVTTTFIILVVRSSVALSLGLVGALSIVRFRAAIKEPEELAYLFLAIGLGIGLGDNQKLITTIAFAVAIVILGLMKLFRRTQADVNLHLNITLSAPDKLSLQQVQQVLKPYCSKLKLLRFDENDKLMELSFLVEFRKLDDLNGARDALQKLSENISITFLDNRGIW